MLTHKAEEYLKCLEFNHKRLNELFTTDEKYWADNLIVTRKRCEHLENHM